MGDRCYVTVSVLTAQAKEAQQFAEKHYGKPSDIWSSERFTFLGFEEVNYGEITDYFDLTDIGIAFNASWSGGDEYGPGTEYARFTETGEVIRKKVWEGEDCITIYELKDLLAQEDGLEKIRDKVTQLAEAIQPLPWDNQEEYGKRYLARKLIDPTQA